MCDSLDLLNQGAELERLRALAHSITGLITITGEDGPSLHDPGYRSIVAAALTRWFDEYEIPRVALARARPVLERNQVLHRQAHRATLKRIRKG